LEDRFERRFGFDPLFGFDPFTRARFLRGDFGFNPFFGGGSFGFDPFFGGGGFGFLGAGVTPAFVGDSAGFSGGSVASSSGAGSLADEAQALVLAEQARAERIANRRKLFDQYLYERAKTPTPEEDRQRYQQQQLGRSLNQPPVTEIWSGKALNDILADLHKRGVPSDAMVRSTFTLPLDQAGLQHINLTRGAGNIGLLKNRGRLTWPVALSGTDFQRERERLTVQARDAVRQAEDNSQVDAAIILQMTGDVESLDRKLRRKALAIAPDLYIEAKTFLHRFTDAIQALRQDDVGSHFSGEYVLGAKTVPELVRAMKGNGLQFAAALPGDEGPYLLLHQALATYHQAVQSRAAAR
jgi:hypothetical protein